MSRRLTYLLLALGVSLGLGVWFVLDRFARTELLVTSDPAGASVFLDRTFVGVTPLTLTGIRPGPHQLRLERAKHLAHTRRVTVRRGRHTVEIKLQSVSSGRLCVKSDPSGAEVYLDNGSVATTPAWLDGLAPGSHELRIEKVGYSPIRQTVQIGAGNETVVIAKLQLELLDHYREAIKKDPANISNYGELGRIYILEGEFDKAVEVLLQGIEAMVRYGKQPDKSFSEFMAKLGWARRSFDWRHWAALSRKLLDLARTKPKDLNTLRVLHDLFVQKEQWKEILDLCAIPISAGLQPTEVYFWRMQANGKLGDRAAVDRDVETVLELIRSGKAGALDYGWLRNGLGKTGRWDDMIRICDVLVQQNPDLEAFRFWRMQAAILAGNWKLVSQEFDGLVQSGILAKRRRPEYTHRAGTQVNPDFHDLLWAWAMAKLHLHDAAGIEALVREYAADLEASYWVDAVRGEQWLDDPRGDPPARVLAAIRCPRPPEIDGRLDEPVWNSAPAATRFYDWRSAKPSNLHPSLRALYDDECLYLGVECDEQDARKGKGDPGGVAVGLPAANTGIELFLDPDRDARTYKQFCISYPGIREDYDCVKEPFSIVELEPWAPAYRFQMTAELDTKVWRIELAVPFKVLDIEVPPKPEQDRGACARVAAGTAWRFNIVCCGSSKAGTNASFVPVYGSFHQPTRFALLLFR